MAETEIVYVLQESRSLPSSWLGGFPPLVFSALTRPVYVRFRFGHLTVWVGESGGFIKRDPWRVLDTEPVFSQFVSDQVDCTVDDVNRWLEGRFRLVDYQYVPDWVHNMLKVLPFEYERDMTPEPTGEQAQSVAPVTVPMADPVVPSGRLSLRMFAKRFGRS